MGNEVATTTKFDLQVLTGDLSEAIFEEMDGLGPIPYDTVKIPSGGSLSFEIPTDDEDHPEDTKELKGVILFHHAVNGYWPDKFDGQNNPPVCSSYDGKTGVDVETGECKNCATCPHNQFGSDANGSGKACKNMHRCYILREGNPVPILLTLPPSSLKSLRDYIGKKIVLKGMRCYQVITSVTLKKDKSKDGITYSKAVFKAAGVLDGKELEMAKAYAESLKANNQNVEITEDEYNTNQATGQNANADFQRVPEDVPREDNPFAQDATETEFEQADAVQEELPV